MPPPKVASTQDRLDLDTSRMTKSILKHRTISEMLTTPGRSASPNMEFPSSVDASRETSDDEGEADAGQGSLRSSGRPAIFAVRSDTNLSAKKRRTGGSPPASERLLQKLDQAPGPVSERSNSSNNVNGGGEERRHISFNQRVDQCIAVDVEDDSDEDEDGDDDEDDVDEDDSDGGEYSGRRGSANETSEDETPSSDDEVLTMKSSPRTSPSWPLTSAATVISSRGSSPGSDHQTIAKLAPTLLKTSETFPGPSPAVVDPTGFKQLHFGPNGEGNQPTLASQSFGYDDGDDDNDASQTRYSQWDADDDFGGDFDYFNGPDMSESYPGERDGSNHGSATHSSTDDANEGEDINAAEENSNTQSSAARAGPKSILKRRPIPSEADLAADSVAGDVDILGTSQPASAAPPAPAVHSPGEGFQSPTSPTSPGSPSSGERGRPSQRLGSSASYERVQDASRSGGVAAAGSSGRGRSSSNGSVASSSTSPTPTGSGMGADDGAGGSFAGGSGSGTVNNNSSSSSTNNTYRPSERRESFRGRAGDGAKAMGPGQQSGPASAPRLVRGANQGQSASGTAVDSDSDGRGSFDFASPNYPASPLLGDRKEGETDGSDGLRTGGDGNDAKMYGRREDDSKWADEGAPTAVASSPVQAKKRSSASGKKVKRQQAGDEYVDDNNEGHQRLSVDLENLPRVDASKSPEDAPGGPTPLNTPTLALAKSRSSARQRGGSASTAGRSTDEDSKAPPSPTIPRRSSATGALVAPSDADRDAGVRVPLAHDYVEEDEGGIVGRAVEIVNTARDLIGALLGTGGDRGRSWREAS